MQFLDFVTKFYIRKIKDKHKIISQATTKKLVSNLSNISNYFGVWCATDFIAFRLNTLINFTSAAFGSTRNHIRMRLRKKFVIYSWFAILCCHLVCRCGETKSPCKFYKGKKSSKKGKCEITKWCMERLFEKLGLVKFPKLPGAMPQGGFIVPQMSFQLQRANMLTHIELWPTAIKLNPSWKTEVRKSTWTKPWTGIYIYGLHLSMFHASFSRVYANTRLYIAVWKNQSPTYSEKRP